MAFSLLCPCIESVAKRGVQTPWDLTYHTPNPGHDRPAYIATPFGH